MRSALCRSDKSRRFDGVAVVADLTQRDYDAALRWIGEAAAADGAQPFDAAVIEYLPDLVPADHTGYYEFEDTASAPGLNVFFAAHPLDWPAVDWASTEVAETADSWPLLDARMNTSTVPRRLSDFLTPLQLRRNPWYDTILRPSGVMFQMKVWLPAPAGITRAFFLLRNSDRRDFSERDRALLALLRPHLATIRDRWERRHQPRLLTKREQEVLELVADGLTNIEIADKLVLSGTTIRTHLENIFEKLGVHTRTAAVAWLNATRRIL